MDLVLIGVDVFGALGFEAARFSRRLASFAAARKGTRGSKELELMQAHFIMRLHVMHSYCYKSPANGTVGRSSKTKVLPLLVFR